MGSPEMRWMAALNMRKGPYAPFGKGKGKKGNGWWGGGSYGMAMPMLPPSAMLGKGWRPSASQSTQGAIADASQTQGAEASAAQPVSAASAASPPTAGDSDIQTGTTPAPVGPLSGANTS